jgi:hypothetical protein
VDRDKGNLQTKTAMDKQVDLLVTTLKKYVLAKAFYSVEEYMNDYTDRQDGK